MRSCKTCGIMKTGRGINCKSCAMKIIRANEPKEVSARRNNKGSKWTEQGRKNLSEARMGIKPWNAGLRGESGQVAWNKGLPAEQQPFFGREHSDSAKQKMSRANIDRIDEGTHNWLNDGDWDSWGHDHVYEWNGARITRDLYDHLTKE